MDEREFRRSVLLSVQRALVGEITPEMRAVEVEISPKRVVVRVFTDGEAPESVREDFDAGAIAQVVADFPCPDEEDPEVAFEFERIDAPRPIVARGTMVFARAGTRFETKRAG
jgi:hypothetical protein